MTWVWQAKAGIDVKHFQEALKAKSESEREGMGPQSQMRLRVCSVCMGLVNPVLSMLGAAATWRTHNVLESSSCPRAFPL
jgi:hypothetical protein